MKLNHDTRFVIYGAGEVGSNCCSNLISKGYKVIAGVDKKKRGSGILPNIITYGLDDDICCDKEGVCIVICLANGLIHKDVAFDLYEAGYSNIVFIPMGFCIKDVDKYKLTEQYNRILCGDLSDSEEINCFEKYKDLDLDYTQSIVRTFDKEYVILCPLEMLFSESMELWTGDKTKIHTIDKYKDRPIASNNPCKALFDYIGGKNEDAEYYFNSKKEEYSVDKKQKQLIERSKLYSIYEHEFNKKSDFFIEGAPEAVWNPNNYWNLVGGHHRTLYLLHKGVTYFPIKVKKTDFEKWNNVKKAELLKDFVCKERISELYAPIPHPGFINVNSRNEVNGSTMLEAVLSQIEPRNIKGRKVLDYTDGAGYFARNFARMGANATYVSNNRVNRELARICGDLLYQKYDIVDDVQEKKDEKYDLIICDNSVYKFVMKYVAEDVTVFVIKEEKLQYLGVDKGISNCIYSHISKGNKITIIKEKYDKQSI